MQLRKLVYIIKPHAVHTRIEVHIKPSKKKEIIFYSSVLYGRLVKECFSDLFL